eukprot:1553-Prorocentrum_lima.AAC.1
MTSSLVGSEMCIRDRAKTTRFAMEDKPKPTRLEELDPDVEEEAIGASSTVSYTHLTLPTICSV